VRLYKCAVCRVCRKKNKKHLSFTL